MRQVSALGLGLLLLAAGCSEKQAEPSKEQSPAKPTSAPTVECGADISALTAKAEVTTTSEGMDAGLRVFDRCSSTTRDVSQLKAIEAAREPFAQRRSDAYKKIEEDRRRQDPQSQWQYQETEDRITSKTTKLAYLKSFNSLNLDFPYSGSNYGQLAVRQHPQYGLDVYLRVDKGQITCSEYTSCKIIVRFDDKPAITFTGSEPSDNSSDLVFLRNAQRFIAGAKGAKKILVQLGFYQNGNQVLEFETVDPLVWAGEKRKK